MKSAKMYFETGNIYHIFNQGNNRQKIFFSRDNYIFFLEKVKLFLVPYVDVFAWCLMPNHFHFMVLVKEVEITVKKAAIHVATPSHPVNNNLKLRTINESIAIMLRSYARAIHKQNGSTGALFREETKAECLNKVKGITPSFYNTSAGAKMHIDCPEKQYPQICFDYIHQNPVKNGLVKQAEDWEFSSSRDYLGLRNGKIVNKEKAREFLIF